MKKLILMILCLLVWLDCSGESKEPNCPNFILEDIHGNYAILHSILDDGPVLMCTWALWCKMSIKELDALKPFYYELRSMSVQILAVSQDRESAVPDVRPFTLSHGWKYRVLLDPDNLIRELFDITAMPMCYVIDREGDIVFAFWGYKPGDEEIIVDTLRNLFGS